MQEIGNKIESIPDNIVDESFFHRSKSDFDLFIYFDQEKLSLTAWNSEDHSLAAFETQKINSIRDISDPVVLNGIFSRSVIGKDPTDYNNRVVFSGLRNVTLVPNALFNPEELRLQHTFSVPSGDTEVKEHSDELRITDARSIYSIPGDLESHFQNMVGDHDLFHASTAFIESQLLKNRNRNEQICSLIIHTSFFEILVISGRQLVLYNTFDIENPESVLYYLLFCCEQLDLNPETLILELAGSIDTSSAIFTGVKNYFSNIKFGEGPADVKMSYKFHDTPSHFYYPALNFPVCV